MLAPRRPALSFPRCLASPSHAGSGVLAVLLLAVFLEPIEDAGQSRGGEKPPPAWSTLLSTFRLFRDKRLCLLSLLPLYSGLQQGFLSGEYTRVGAGRGAASWTHALSSGPPSSHGTPTSEGHRDTSCLACPWWGQLQIRNGSCPLAPTRNGHGCYAGRITFHPWTCKWPCSVPGTGRDRPDAHVAVQALTACPAQAPLLRAAGKQAPSRGWSRDAQGCRTRSGRAGSEWVLSGAPAPA